MFIIYDFVFLIIAIFYLPIYLFKKKFHRGFLSRLGFLPKHLPLKQPIWVHAVSVGEAIAVKGLIEGLRISWPDKDFVISTVTATGNKIAKGIARQKELVTYLPLDMSFIVARVIDKVNPGIFIIAETELWPNLISYLYRKKIPIVVVNGRISDASFKGYRTIRFLLKPVLNKINLFCVQTLRDKERLESLGVLSNKIQVTGNMKFDIKQEILDFNTSGLNLKEQEKLLVCGSTHKGEEEIILEAYKDLYRDYAYLRLLIAPRHPERTPEIEKIAIRYRFISTRVSQLAGLPVSQLNQPTCQPVNQPTVFILDTIGQLSSFYSIADIVFVGGSLVKKGGHNILEPVALGKPVLFGPFMFNFRDIADLFLKAEAAIPVNNKNELISKIKYLLQDPSQIAALSQRAKELIQQNQGATRRNLELITNQFSENKEKTFI